MAILFTDEAGGGGQSGLFVSHASDRVYLGLVERCHRDPRDLVLRPGSPKSGTGHIVSVPRAQIAAESVGTMAELNTAIERAPRSAGCTCVRPPPRLPSGVRTASTLNASGMGPILLAAPPGPLTGTR